MTHYYDIRGGRQALPGGLRLHPADLAMIQTPPVRNQPAMINAPTLDQEIAYEARLDRACIPTVRRAPRVEGFKDGYVAAQAEGTPEPTREQLTAYRQSRLDRVHYSLMEANSALSGYQDGWQLWQEATRDND